MDNLTNWVLTAIGGAFLSGLVWIGKASIAQVVKKLDEILRELKELNRITITHEEQIKVMTEKVNDHEDRLRRLEDI